MYSFRKSKKGFTLIELMVVVAIIGVLALLGLRVYSGQQAKAKEAIVKANAGTVQTLIQSELADGMITRDAAATLAATANLHDPFTAVAMEAATWFPEAADTPGEIQITLVSEIFYVQGYGATGLIPEELTARR